MLAPAIRPTEYACDPTHVELGRTIYDNIINIYPAKHLITTWGEFFPLQIQITFEGRNCCAGAGMQFHPTWCNAIKPTWCCSTWMLSPLPRIQCPGLPLSKSANLRDSQFQVRNHNSMHCWGRSKILLQNQCRTNVFGQLKIAFDDCLPAKRRLTAVIASDPCHVKHGITNRLEFHLKEYVAAWLRHNHVHGYARKGANKQNGLFCTYASCTLQNCINAAVWKTYNLHQTYVKQKQQQINNNTDNNTTTYGPSDTQTHT